MKFLWMSFHRFFPRLLGLLCMVFLLAYAKVRSATSAVGIINHEVVCQGDQLRIRCPNSSYALQIHGGSFGRTQNGDTVCPYAGSKNDFYYNCGENDVTEKLQELCEKKKKCIFKVGNALFGDPCRGHAYLSMIYSCVERKRRKNRNKSTHPPSTTIWPTFITNASSNSSTNASSFLETTTGIPTQNTFSNLTGLQNIPVLYNRRNGNPGVFMSLIVWIVFVKGRAKLFMTVFLITIGSATLLVLVVYIIMLLIQHKTKKKRDRQSINNMEAQLQKLNHSTTLNGDTKKHSDLDTLSNSFPAPISTLPPPPDDMIYPSPSPEMMNATRPPPPAPLQRGSSLDDISKIVQDRNRNVALTRSMSMRTRPPDYYSKGLNFDNVHTKLQPIVGCPEIHTVLRPKDSTMYMNPMYAGNGHMKELPC